MDEPTNYLDVVHIEWLKRYLNDYENAFILISHDIPFLNSVVNLIYHMENQRLDRYVGNYDQFQEVYAMKKAQLEAAYNKQQKEIAQLKDFVARNKATRRYPQYGHVPTEETGQNGCNRTCRREAESLNSTLSFPAHQAATFSRQRIWLSAMMSHCQHR